MVAACSVPGDPDISAPPGERPNIVVILADDMGYGDVAAYNPESRIPTPNLDRLAAQGIRFTDAHSSSAVCSPSRYALLTGRYSWRTWMKSGVLWPPEDRPLIEADRATVASLLGDLGYRTAVIGKWHVGLEWGRDAAGEVDYDMPLRYGPADVGFDESFIIAGSLDMVPYAFYRDHQPTAAVTEWQEALPFPRYIRAGPRAEDFDPGQALDRITSEAVAFIDRAGADENPFLLYLPLTSPHKPVWPAERFVGATDLGPYGDFVHQTDWTVGEVLAALDRSGVTDETFVLFSSDNGSFMYRRPPGLPDHLADEALQSYDEDHHRANYVWRGTKADIWEAGHRVPFIVRWPGEIEPGTVAEQAVGLVDLVATVADIASLALPQGVAEDSFSLLPVMRGGEWATPRPAIVHHSINGMFALRDGDWKMVFGNGSGGRERPAGVPFEGPYTLFDVAGDPAETTSVIDRHPEVANRLERTLEAIRAEQRR